MILTVIILIILSISYIKFGLWFWKDYKKPYRKNNDKKGFGKKKGFEIV